MRRGMQAVGAAILGAVLAGCSVTVRTGSDGNGGTAPERHAVEDAGTQPGGTSSSPSTAASEPVAYDSNARMALSATQAEPIRGNDAWCGSMQLCWNDLMDGYNGGRPIEGRPNGPNEELDHLNERLFAKDDIRDDHYYTAAGPMTPDMKARIEKGISDRFGQTSDILDKFAWDSEDSTIVYAMLYRSFSFATPFSVEDATGRFGTKERDNAAEGVAYFQADAEEQRKQVRPLYYEDVSHHAVSIRTKEGDVVTLVKNPTGGTLGEMWDDAMGRAAKANAESAKPLGTDEAFECPNLDIDLSREYEEWRGVHVGSGLIVDKALQALRLRLDNEGGQVKSEAGTAVVQALDPTPSRRFCYDDTFVMFVSDGDAPDKGERPYVGVLVSDITQFQAGAKKTE